MAGSQSRTSEFYVVGKHQPVVVQTSTGRLTGFLYVPELKRRLSEILNDERQFLPLTDVTDDQGERFDYLAVNKRFVISVRES